MRPRRAGGLAVAILKNGVGVVMVHINLDFARLSWAEGSRAMRMPVVRADGPLLAV